MHGDEPGIDLDTVNDDPVRQQDNRGSAIKSDTTWEGLVPSM
ncbi:hypothetical protein GGE65_004919 [Skermanella aerolata]